MPTTTTHGLSHEKNLEAETKRWISLYRQATGALKAAKLQRREKLLVDALKLARDLKEKQMEWMPDSSEQAEIANSCLSASLRELGLTYRMLDEDPTADRCLPYLLEAMPIEEAADRKEFGGLFRLYDALCQTYAARKELTKYEDICRRALAEKEKQVGQWHPSIINYLMDLAWVLDEQKKYKESLSIKKEALSICQSDQDAPAVDRVTLKHGVAYTEFLSQGLSEMEAARKAVASLDPEENRIFTGLIAQEYEGLI